MTDTMELRHGLTRTMGGGFIDETHTLTKSTVPPTFVEVQFNVQQDKTVINAGGPYEDQGPHPLGGVGIKGSFASLDLELPNSHTKESADRSKIAENIAEILFDLTEIN